jgi:hypothetical protein
MALGLLCVLCTSEQAGEITVSIVMACRIRVVAEQEPACLLADRNLEASVCRSRARPPPGDNGGRMMPIVVRLR